MHILTLTNPNCGITSELSGEIQCHVSRNIARFVTQCLNQRKKFKDSITNANTKNPSKSSWRLYPNAHLRHHHARPTTSFRFYSLKILYDYYLGYYKCNERFGICVPIVFLVLSYHVHSDVDTTSARFRDHVRDGNPCWRGGSTSRIRGRDTSVQGCYVRFELQVLELISC